MNIFRIPLNLYVIIVLFTLRYMNPFTVALIAGIMSFVSFLIALSLNIWKPASSIKNTAQTGVIYTGIEDKGDQDETEKLNQEN